MVRNWDMSKERGRLRASLSTSHAGRTPVHRRHVDASTDSMSVRTAPMACCSAIEVVDAAILVAYALASSRMEVRRCSAHGRGHPNSMCSWLSVDLQNLHLKAGVPLLNATYFADKRYLSQRDRRTAARWGRDMERVGAIHPIVGNSREESTHFLARP